jgi:hypothetical protein
LVFCPRCGDEYREGFTWCHDCDVALVETLPAEATPPTVEPLEPPSAQQVEDRARSLRLQGLGLVLLTALAGNVVATLEGWLGSSPRSPTEGHDEAYFALGRITTDLSILCLLAYVLFRQGRRLRQLGLTARWSDLAWGLGLAVVGLLPWAIRDLVGHGALGSWAVSAASWQGVSALWFLSLLCADAKLWLVLGAYAFTELHALSGSVLLAVTAAVGLQELYLQHSPAGVVSLAVFAVFYWRTRRVTPLLLGGVGAHLWIWVHSARTAG